MQLRDALIFARQLANIRRALSTGLPNNVAYRCSSSSSWVDRNKRVGAVGYRTLSDGQLLHLHPSSALYRQEPDLVIFNETVTTSRLDCRWCCSSRSKYCIVTLVIHKALRFQDLYEGRLGLRAPVAPTLAEEEDERS